MLGRILPPVVAALIAAFVLTYGGSDWYEDLVRWLHPATLRTTPNRWAATSGPEKKPITVTPMRPLGTDSSVSPTPLALILVRTQPGRNSREGFAQIGVNALSPQTYQAGALLANGARLLEIYPRYVVLQRDGSTARLSIQGEFQPGTPPDGGGLFTVGGGASAHPHEATTSADQLANYVKVSPIFTGSRLRGVSVYAGPDATPFTKLGLESGDLLTHINGAPIVTTAQALTALHGLLDGGTLTVQIARQGVTQTLSLDGALFAPPSQKSAHASHVDTFTRMEGAHTTL